MLKSSTIIIYSIFTYIKSCSSTCFVMSFVCSSMNHKTTSLPAASDSFFSSLGITSLMGLLKFPIKIPPSPKRRTSVAKNVSNPKQLFNCHIKFGTKRNTFVNKVTEIEALQTMVASICHEQQEVMIIYLKHF
jgi:hypothetical protein